MPVIYACPGCRRRFSTAEFLAGGGLCPDCRCLLSSMGTDDRAREPAPGAAFFPGGGPAASGPDHDIYPGNGSGGPDEVIALLVTPVKGRPGETGLGAIPREIPAIAQLLNALSRARPLCLEISGFSSRRFLVVRCRRVDAPLVRGQLTGLYGAPEIAELAENLDPARLFDLSDQTTCTSRLTLARPAGLPIRTYRELAENDTLLPILGAFYDLAEGEAALAQVLIHGPAGKDWATGYKQELLSLKRRGGTMLPPAQILKWVLLFLGSGLLSLYVMLMQWLSLSWLLVLAAGMIAFAVRFL